MQSMYEINEQVAREINEEALRDPDSPYAGKSVGLVKGKVVIIADNLAEVSRVLKESKGDLLDKMAFEAGQDFDTPEMIWAIARCCDNSGH